MRSLRPAGLAIILALVLAAAIPTIGLMAPALRPSESLGPRARTAVAPQPNGLPDPHKVIRAQPVPPNEVSIQAVTSCVNGMAGIFPCKGIDLLGQVAVTTMSSAATAASNLWGYVDLDDNREYAVIGLTSGTSVVEITDPVNPRVVGFVAGITSQWREVKVYQFRNQTTGRWDAYAYITTEATNGGIQIINLSALPNSISLAATWQGISTSHTALIGNVDWSTNVANDANFPPLLYINGVNRANGTNQAGFRIVSLANPTSLQQIGSWSNGYAHDIYVHVFRDSRASQCAAGHNPCHVLFNFSGATNGLQIFDVTNPASPTLLGSLRYPNTGYTHSGWISSDTMSLFLMDELDEQNLGTTTLVRTINISNLRQPTLSGGWTGPNRAIEHNGYTIGNKYYMSHYTRGVVILDVTNPAAPSELAFFDSFPTSDATQFAGPWGVYPFLPSGNIIVSDLQRGLLVLREQSGQPPTPTPTPPPGGTVFSDNFETNTGWTVNPNGNDTATTGRWERGDPEATDSSGPKQLGTTRSGANDLVTGRTAGSSAGANDIDGGTTTIRSPSITLPSSANLTLSFAYYLAHGSNASNADFLRVQVVTASGTTTVFERLGSATDVDAAWATATANLTSFAGQSIRIQIVAADASGASLVEAAVDDVTITRQ